MSQNAKDRRPQGFSGWRPRRSAARPAGEAALSHAADALRRAGFADASLVLRWPEIAGAQVARVAEPLRWQDGPEGAVLTLKCEPGAIVFLQHETRLILERLNAYLGKGRVARVRLISGALSRMPPLPDHPGPERHAPALGSAERPTVRDALNALADLRAWRKRRGSNRPD